MYRHEDRPRPRASAAGLRASPAARALKSALSCVLAALIVSPGLALARDKQANLGGGLNEIAAPGAANPNARSLRAAAAPGIVSPVRVDDSGRALVRISLNGKVPAATMLQKIRGLPSVEVSASALDYRAGVIEAWVPSGSLKTLARTAGVLAVVPSSPFSTNVGATTSQGIIQHRVNKLPSGISGRGITVGVLSDSYDVEPSITDAAKDVSTGDLPGSGNPAGNTQPVVVFQDWPIGNDEGRAMLQIVHDVAPKARLGFATANGGELNFADNIRALAGLPGATRRQPGFKADVIVDDIVYLTEPFFQDGIVAQAVDEVASKGVQYFSSAGNHPSSEAYDSDVHLVPPKPSSWASTNLNFTGVPPELYAGGFHNFAGGGRIDIAQTIDFPQGSRISFQWNEPFDPQPPTPVGAPIAQGKGTVPPGGIDTFTFNGTAGQIVQIFIDEDNTTTGTPIPDIVFALLDPDGNLVGDVIDTGTNPEFLNVQLPVTGEYTVLVDAFEVEQYGDYKYTVQPIQLDDQVLSDYNLLFFLPDGTFFAALAEQNLFSQRPIEIGQFPEATFQMVIARANTPNPRNKNVADHIRWVGFDGISPQEYVSYLDPTTFGHNSAKGAMSVAAYAFYAPFIPEYFTSPGPSTIYFDKNNKRLKKIEYREKPDMAAMDGANTTFFYQEDSPNDPDTFNNFFGTSASAPHAAAISALVLQAAGGSGSVKPAKMRKILQDSAFPHDLDPYFSWGVALGAGDLVTINANADHNAISQFDPNVFTLSHIGFRKLKSFSLNGSKGDPTQTPKGIVFDERPTVGQAFQIGRTIGLSPSDVTAKFSLPADPPGVAGQWKQLDLQFRSGSFRSGDLLSFGMDRDEADASGPALAAGGNSADLLGGGVLIPSGKFVDGGASFSGTFEGGGSFRGEFNNLIGKGYSQLDGYGFINAEAAVKAVLKR